MGERRAVRGRRRFEEAAEAFVEERFDEARRAIRPLAEDAPSVPEVRELHGLVLYRLGRWRDARRELAAAYQLSGDVAQHPVWMDCERALGEHAEVRRLWAELGAVSPDPATMTEGRIVAAGTLADAGDVTGAVRLLAAGFRRPTRPALHHLRRAYALADLLERAGEHVEARGLFTWIVQHDPQFGDAADRAASIG